MTAIDYRVDDRIAWIILNRPAELNTVTWAFIEEIYAVTSKALQDDAVRVVVFRGEGSSFSAGADLVELKQEFEDMKAGTLDRSEVWRLEMILQEVTRMLRSSSKISIAATQGWVVGAGLELCVACDLVIADETARFWFSEARVGLTVGGGATYLLPKIVGLTNARKLIYLAEAVDAQEAAAMGLIAEVVPQGEHVARATYYAESIARKSPLATAAHKRLLEESSDIGLTAALQLEATTFLSLMEMPDAQEGIGAFIDKREPNF